MRRENVITGIASRRIERRQWAVADRADVRVETRLAQLADLAGVPGLVEADEDEPLVEVERAEHRVGVAEVAQRQAIGLAERVPERRPRRVEPGKRIGDGEAGLGLHDGGGHDAAVTVGELRMVDPVQHGIRFRFRYAGLGGQSRYRHVQQLGNAGLGQSQVVEHGRNRPGAGRNRQAVGIVNARDGGEDLLPPLVEKAIDFLQSWMHVGLTRLPARNPRARPG